MVRAHPAAQWPAERPVPQVCIEFDVADVAAVGPAALELERAGYDPLQPTARGAVGSDSGRAAVTGGAIVGISYAPVLHDRV